MKNIVVAFFLVISLIWLFFTAILLENITSNEILPLSQANVTENTHVLVVDIEKLALLLDVEYQEENITNNEIKTLTTLDIEVSLVVIYTSINENKVRIKTEVNGEKIRRDMVLGDKLYDYTLIAINPSSVELKSSELNVILKVFKTTTISITDLPKEAPESL